MAIESVTRRTLRSIIADAVGDLVVEGTATAGASTTLIDTNNLLFVDDSALVGAWAFIHTGTSIGDERAISAYSASSDQITSLAWTSSPTTSSQYEIHRKFRVRQYNRAIDQALRRSRWAWLTSKEDTSLLTNSNLLNPMFTNWNAAGTTADNWTNSGANYSQVVVNRANNIGKAITVQAIVYSTTTTFRLQVTDGTTTVSDAHDGSGWNRLSVQITPANNTTALTVRINHSTGSSLAQARESSIHVRGPYSVRLTESGGDVCYVDSVFAPDSFTVYDYPMSSDFHTVNLVEIENGGLMSQFSSGQQVGGSGDAVSNRGKSSLTSRQWRATAGHVNPDPVLHFDSSFFNVRGNRAITIHGLTTPSIPTADTDVIAANIDPIVEYAVYWLNRFSDQTTAAVALNRWREARDDTRIAYPGNSRIVNPL